MTEEYKAWRDGLLIPVSHEPGVQHGFLGGKGLKHHAARELSWYNAHVGGVRKKKAPSVSVLGVVRRQEKRQRGRKG